MIDFLMQPFLGQAVWLWCLVLGFVGTILVLDLGVFNRKDHVIEMKESLKLASIYISFGLTFGLWVWYQNGATSALDYYTVYLIEQTLSLDNLFVMSVIFSSFSVPREYQHRLLVWGIIGVVVLRGLTIVAGAALVQQYDWVLFIFAAILFYTGFKLLKSVGEETKEDFTQKSYVRFLYRHLRITEYIHGKHFFVKTPPANGKSTNPVWHATPLFLALVTIELTDLLFAFDSVPAALAITTDAYIVFTANIFAILGLRAIFFAMEHIIHRFIYLKYSLAILLMFISGKVFYAQFFGHVHAAVSLGLTALILGGGVVASLMRTKKAPHIQH